MKTSLKVFLIMAATIFAVIGIASAIAPEPTVDFTAAPNVTGPFPFTVTFTGYTTGLSSVYGYEWDYGDSSGRIRYTGNSTTHTYMRPGIYSVSLEVFNGTFPYLDVQTHTIVKEGYITVTRVAPSGVSFDWVGSNPYNAAPLTVTFTSHVANLADAGNVTYQWGFSDGDSSTAKDPVHTFGRSVISPDPALSGWHVTLIVTGDGGSDGAAQNIVVYPEAPVSMFSASSPTTGQVPLAVQFQDESSGNGLPLPGGDGVKTFAWDFGDGGTSGAQNPLHAYGAIGLYTVSLNVSTQSGYDVFTRTNYINVTPVTGPVVCPTIIPTTEPAITPVITPATILPDKIGVYQNGIWYLDRNGNGVWDVVVDSNYNFGTTGWTLVTGDWNSDGKAEIGVYKDGIWYLDMDGNGIWTAGVDAVYSFGALGWKPVVGDWNADGKTDIGISNGQTWYLDMNNDGTWEPGTDTVYNFGAAGWTPVTGKF